jgi:hypothetical protein
LTVDGEDFGFGSLGHEDRLHRGAGAQEAGVC